MLSRSDLFRFVAQPGVALRRANIRKRRFRFSLPACRAELDQLQVNGAAVESLAVESENPEAVLEVQSALRLETAKTSVIRWRCPVSSASHPCPVGKSMGKEIERKFLVTGEAWRMGDCSDYRQGYLSIDRKRTMRIRIAGDVARLTVKGITEGATRAEYEYPVPVADAQAMLETLCLRPLIEKRRYRIQHGGLTWEIDKFLGENAGLIVAEIELEHAEQSFDKPAWIGEEVTSDPRFYNANLVNRPYKTWN